MSETRTPIRLLLVDDHVVVRQGLRMLLENHADLVVVGEAARAADALEIARRERPDLVLLDLDLGDASGTDIISDLVAGGCTRVLLLTGLRDPEIHRRGIRLGAAGVVVKDQAGDLLVKAIRHVHDGEVWIDRHTTAALLEEMRHGAGAPPKDEHGMAISELTLREREIVALVAQGHGTQKIANELFISEKTVRNHLASIYDKLGVSDRLELALFAAKHGLAGQPKRS